MGKKITLGIAAAALAVSAMGTASATTVSPGGNTTLAGQVNFKIQGTSSTIYSGSCAMTMHVTLNPQNASFTVNSIDIESPCGSEGGNSVGAFALDLPWTGVPRGKSAYIEGVHFLFSDIGGIFGPPWVNDHCDNDAGGPLFTLQWNDNGQPNAPATSVSNIANATQGYSWYANDSDGNTCLISFQLFLSPFQTFTL